jgi:hypothetical protein
MIKFEQVQLDNIVTAINNRSKLASPNFTGTPTVPTAAVGTNTTQIASTAFVLANAGSGTSQSMPFAFSAYYSGGNSAVSGYHNPDAAIPNKGNCYNGGNGRFTATVAGYYWFEMTALGWQTYGSGKIGITKNGSYYPNANAAPYARGDDSQASHGTVVYLSIGDYVQAYSSVGVYSSYFNFSGHFLGL